MAAAHSQSSELPATASRTHSPQPFCLHPPSKSIGLWGQGKQRTKDSREKRVLQGPITSAVIAESAALKIQPESASAPVSGAGVGTE